MKSMLVMIVVCVVILTECAVAYVLIPSPEALEAAATKSSEEAEKAASDASTTTDGTTPTAAEMEVDLGKFNVVVHQPGANLTLRINFHLIGTVPSEKHEEFGKLLTHNQHRLRDQIIYEIRNSAIADLTDPGLGLIKRRILAKSNDLLGAPMLTTVVFSDFSFIEQ
ncbi:flagellar basal body-associated protein FliL [Pirellula staleyi DSM 6068]|uniref:Flagellar basal body-associated protein FliL n=1 Tax=Pirellula staleyi (strain ATCC 27377 / DSM 6068 / ICPB 4128) TaxID=530564 RepID=D2R537_PIRSD|nr:flagellar basal body-associated protein FliL [Pirellula staleyi]ADB18999.1 flagellar basal body-associated protein FliL [Pirellula staleyi DSM 6068]